MTSVDEDADNLVIKASKELIDEQPKIGTAVKNLIAMVIGKSISDPSTKLLFGGDYIFTPEIGLACGRCLLQAIQKYELEEPHVWGNTHTQPDDQSGKERLDEILKYKCLYDMKKRISAQNGGKVSTIFGRSYLKISKSWPTIKSTIILPDHIYAEMFDYFISHFESSLVMDINDTYNVMNDDSLVWSINFYETLKQRQEKRKEEAKKRVAMDKKTADRDAEESEWEDSDDENYKPKQNLDGESDNEIVKEKTGNLEEETN